MNLRSKFVLMIIIAAICLSVINLAVFHFFIFNRFQELENNFSQRELNRCQQAIKNEILFLENSCFDWASWDDAYQFVEDVNEEFIRVNLTPSVYAQFNIIYFFDKSGKIVYGQARDASGEKVLSLPMFAQGYLPPTHPLFLYNLQAKTSKERYVSGLLVTKEGAMLVSARPILKSDETGPTHGTLLMGKFFNDDLINSMEKRLDLHIDYWLLNDVNANPIQFDFLDELKTKGVVSRKASDKEEYLYTFLNDISGKPALLLRLTMPQTIRQAGLDAIYNSLLFTLLGLICFLIIIVIIMKKGFTNHLKTLIDRIDYIKNTNDLSLRISTSRTDEIGILAQSFNAFLAKLEELSKRLEKSNKQLEAEVEKRLLELTEINRELAGDIQKRIKAEIALSNSEKRYRELVEKAGALVLVCNQYGEITFASPSFKAILGFSPVELLEDGWWQKSRLNKLDGYREKEEMAKVASGKKDVNSLPYEIKVCDFLGREHWIYWQDALGDNNTVIGIGQDITVRKIMEEELKQSQKKLQEASATKDKFFSIIAHDLRTPLQILTLASEMLIDDSQKDVPVNSELVFQIHKSSVNLSSLLENLLQWAGAQSGRIPFTPVELYLDEIITETFNLLAENAKKKEVKLITLVPPQTVLFADKAMFFTVLRNLVSNSIKFTGAGGKIVVASEKFTHNTQISVRDTGVGIEPENLKKLFTIEEHHTTKGTASETGTGLGLIMCREFVGRHGGEITVESKIGKGSNFTFTIPNRN